MSVTENLSQRAIQVRDERQWLANTAYRIGALFYDIIQEYDRLSGEFSDLGVFTSYDELLLEYPTARNGSYARIRVEDRWAEYRYGADGWQFTRYTDDLKLTIIRSDDNDEIPARDTNVFSALLSLLRFHRKDAEDSTEFLQHFLSGLHAGEFIDSFLGGKGTGILPDKIQTDRLEVRGSAVFKEVVMNRWSAQEGNVTYSEAGTIERVDLMPDGTYDLYLRRRWDNDVTALAEHDICFGSVNDLFGSGAYYDSWFRVLNVMQAENKISVTLYPDEEVPGGVNHEPQVGMAITRRGNVVNEQRQGYWYISSYEGCVCFLDGVTKPILEESNYGIIIGRLKRLEIFTNLPINYLQSYLYCRGIAVQDIHRIDYQGTPVRQENFRGFWSREVAETEPYQSTSDRYDTVSHLGCEWMCLITGTLDEPKYGCTGWAMIRGNPAFTIELTSTNNWEFDADRIAQRDESGDYMPFTSLVVTGWLYNQDVTESILDSDVSWARDTGNAAEDNAWAIRRADAGRSLPLTVDDLGTDYLNRTSCTFKATALIRDGQKFEVAEDYMTF